ncbi:MAG: DUF896 domain-containing protein [Clostridia bacterium]|nr:DUF896 domain-containing protein [Clostridia bacterium]
MDKIIKRINELYAKSKAEGLTDAEKTEQAELRQKYIKAFRQGVINTMDNVRVVDEKGNKKKLERKNK